MVSIIEGHWIISIFSLHILHKVSRPVGNCRGLRNFILLIWVSASDCAHIHILEPLLLYRYFPAPTTWRCKLSEFVWCVLGCLMNQWATCLPCQCLHSPPHRRQTWGLADRLSRPCWKSMETIWGTENYHSAKLCMSLLRKYQNCVCIHDIDWFQVSDMLSAVIETIGKENVSCIHYITE